jgi:hypothetical protein
MYNIKFLTLPFNQLKGRGKAFEKCADHQHSHHKSSEQNKVVACLFFLIFQVHFP